jgi:hypothetical protein
MPKAAISSYLIFAPKFKSDVTEYSGTLMSTLSRALNIICATKGDLSLAVKFNCFILWKFKRR